VAASDPAVVNPDPIEQFTARRFDCGESFGAARVWHRCADNACGQVIQSVLYQECGHASFLNAHARPGQHIALLKVRSLDRDIAKVAIRVIVPDVDPHPACARHWAHDAKVAGNPVAQDSRSFEPVQH
jgi:hypothetical protein